MIFPQWIFTEFRPRKIYLVVLLLASQLEKVFTLIFHGLQFDFVMR